MVIYVGNLALETTDEELRKEFAEFGDVISIAIMNDKYIGSGQPRSYAYVEMASKSDGAIAIARLEGKKLRERLITLVEALPLSDKSGTPSVHIRSRVGLIKKESTYKIS
ncbi:MAG: RNA-binding protein [Chloroflexota bacterium]